MVKVHSVEPLAIESGTFSNSTNATLYVPVGSKAAYEAADYWKEFKEIVEFSPAIEFADANVKALCVANWDTDGDGELSEAEAAAVTDLGTVFKSSRNVKTFNELRYFTGLKSIGTNAFYYSHLEEITLPESVTEIKYNAFQGAYISSITLPEGLTTIGSNAFSYCENLTSFSFGDQITTIGEQAFACCTGLKSLTFGSCRPTFGSGAFYRCTALSKVVIKDMVAWCSFNHGTSDANPMYYAHHIYQDDDTEIINLVIPAEVTSIYQNAFYQCTAIQSVTLHDDLIAIGNSAFSDCSGLQGHVDIPQSVAYISRNVFYNCGKLSSVTIPEGVKSIGYFAFGNCNSLTSVTIPSTVTSMEDGAFYCENLQTVTSLIAEPFSIEKTQGWAKFTDNVFNNAVLYVPQGAKAKYEAQSGWSNFSNIAEIIPLSPAIDFADANVKVLCVSNWDTDGDGGLSEAEAAAVTNLGEVFRANTSITSFDELRYFTGLTVIGEMAFTACTGLTSVKIPAGVNTIGGYAFQNCTALTSIEIPTNVTTIGGAPFYGCSGLTSITIPNSVKSIGWSAFYKCSSLKLVVIEDGDDDLTLETNPNSSSSTTPFDGCSIESLYLGRNIIHDAYRSPFAGTNNLLSVTIGNSVTSICDYAFNICTKLAFIRIPEGVTNIGKRAFNRCENMTSIIIPTSMNTIDEYAFSDCYRLAAVCISDLQAWLNIAFSNYYSSPLYAGHHLYLNNQKITELVIPDGITDIKDYAFLNAFSIASVTIPSSVTKIGTFAFGNCEGLQTVTIPASVVEIGSAAFSGCSALTEVVVENNIPVAIDKNTFSNRTTATLYVPAGCKAAYEAADYWKEFKEIVEPEDLDTDTDISVLDNVLYINKVEGRTGNQLVLPVQMKNSAPIRGFQFDLYLPDGVTVAKNSKGRIVASLSSGRLDDGDEHTLTVAEQSDGGIRFLCGSQYDETFTGNDGEVLTVTVDIAEDMEDGDYRVSLKNIKLTETDISKYYETPVVNTTLTVASYMPGDINGDGKVDVSDYIGIANRILGNTPEGFVEKAADVNEDGVIDVSDYIGVANIILTGSIYGKN